MTLRIYRDETRAHPYIADALTFYALTLGALHPPLDENSPANAILACTAVRADLVAAIAPFIQAAKTGVQPEEMDLVLHPKRPEPDGIPILGVHSLSVRVVTAMFSLFAERANDWLRSTNSSYQKWPPVSNFARVIRNAIVHGGTLNATSPTSPVVSWRGLTYSHQNAGRQIINTGTDLSHGDLIVLMLELELELNDLGAPYPLP